MLSKRIEFLIIINEMYVFKVNDVVCVTENPSFFRLVKRREKIVCMIRRFRFFSSEAIEIMNGCFFPQSLSSAASLIQNMFAVSFFLFLFYVFIRRLNHGPCH